MKISKLYDIALKVNGYRELSAFANAGAVSCALVTESGNVYTGVNIDACCGIGFCAEHSAIAAMITAGESRIAQIIAVGLEGNVLPPCGRCRELIGQVNTSNKDTMVVLARNKQVPLYELIPSDWKESVSDEQLELR